MAHVGLSDSHGKTVIYLDMELYDAFFGTALSSKATVESDIEVARVALGHELKTIAEGA